MRLIDADRLLDRCKFYHLPNGDIAVPIIDVQHAPTIEMVEQLPPAQPEIIRCRECKFASGDSRICMKFGHSPIGELDFCAWAERRTDD